MADNLERIELRTSDAPDVDSAMVASVRDAIYRGQYRVEPNRIAKKLIDMDTAVHRLHRREHD